MAELTASGIVRAFLSVATLVSGVLGFLSRDLRWFAAAAAFGTMWTVGDVLVAKVLIPLADFAARLLEGGVDGPPVETRPTVEDTIRLLESHLAGGGPRRSRSGLPSGWRIYIGRRTTTRPAPVKSST